MANEDVGDPIAYGGIQVQRVHRMIDPHHPDAPVRLDYGIRRSHGSYYDVVASRTSVIDAKAFIDGQMNP